VLFFVCSFQQDSSVIFNHLFVGNFFMDLNGMWKWNTCPDAGLVKRKVFVLLFVFYFTRSHTHTHTLHTHLLLSTGSLSLSLFLSLLRTCKKTFVSLLSIYYFRIRYFFFYMYKTPVHCFCIVHWTNVHYNRQKKIYTSIKYFFIMKTESIHLCKNVKKILQFNRKKVMKT
jgi:hypothetical protein